MIYDYNTLKNLSDDFSIIVLFKFLSKLRNASLRPGDKNSTCSPILFWWFEENNKEINQLIKDAVDNYEWEEQWTLEEKGNNKWLLFPEHIRDAERIVKGVKDKNIEISYDGTDWLIQNEPEFGCRANQDLDNFRKYFRKVIEDYLRKKEEDGVKS